MKTRWIGIDWFSQRDTQGQGRKKPKTLHVLALTRCCRCSRTGGFRISRRTEKSRVTRTIHHLQELMRQIRYDSLEDQAHVIHQLFQWHYAYLVMVGNLAGVL